MVLATICYLRKDGKTLFMYRNKKEKDINAGFHIGVGGKIEENESLGECIIREFEDETGLKIKNPQLRGFVSFLNKGDKDWHVAVYTAAECSGELKQSKEGELVWVDNSKIDKLELLEGDKLFIPYLFQPGFFTATLKYKIEQGQRILVSSYIKRH